MHTLVTHPSAAVLSELFPVGPLQLDREGERECIAIFVTIETVLKSFERAKRSSETSCGGSVDQIREASNKDDDALLSVYSGMEQPDFTDYLGLCFITNLPRLIQFDIAEHLRGRVQVCVKPIGMVHSLLNMLTLLRNHVIQQAVLRRYPFLRFAVHTYVTFSYGENDGLPTVTGYQNISGE